MKRERTNGAAGEVVLYRNKEGRIALDVRLVHETVWLSLNQLAEILAELFGGDKSVISHHFLNIFATNELNRDSVVACFATTAADGKTYQVEHFNLDVIISVGYRVNSQRGTQFRIWPPRCCANTSSRVLPLMNIGAFLFLWFLDGNGLLYGADGSKRLADNARVALTLLVAESRASEKDIICTVIVNLINRENL